MVRRPKGDGIPRGRGRPEISDARHPDPAANEALLLARELRRSGLGRQEGRATITDGQRKIVAALLALLGLFLFGVVEFAPLPHRPTPASVFLMLVAACLLFIAARLFARPGDEGDELGLVARWANGRIVLMFAAILFLLAYGLWAMFTGSL